MDYLKENGINEDVIGIVEHLSMEKEGDQYREWL